MSNKNVILTSVRLSAIGWFTGIVSEIHRAIYKEPIHWRYEISTFEATRERRPLPKGWCTVWDANPLQLVERGYDKVLVLYRDVMNLVNAHCWYNKSMSIADCIREGEFRYLQQTIKKYDKLLETHYEHNKIYYVDINKCNINNTQDNNNT